MVVLEVEGRTRDVIWRPARWIVPLFALAAVVLVAWIAFLVRDLPSTHAAPHWDIAWAGFDAALALLLGAVAIAAWRRSSWLEGTATAAAALLFVDAWFDILTSSSHMELGLAIAEGVLIEIPLALLCLVLARDADRVLNLASSRRPDSTLSLDDPRPEAAVPTAPA